MTIRYRVVYFVPSLPRSPMAILVQTSEGTHMEMLDKLPDAEALGGQERKQVMGMCVEIMQDADDFDKLPRALNGLGALGPVVEEPGEVAWVNIMKIKEGIAP